MIPFPNDELEFSLPDNKYEQFIKIAKTNLEIKETQILSKNVKSKNRASTNTDGPSKEKRESSVNKDTSPKSDDILIENNSDNSDDVEITAVTSRNSKTPKTDSRKRTSILSSNSIKAADSGSKKVQPKKRKD